LVDFLHLEEPGLGTAAPSATGLTPLVLPPTGAAASPVLPTGSGARGVCPKALPLKHETASNAIADFFMRPPG
jgi:hypothetical protein